MTETAYVRGESGVIFLMDVPGEGTAAREQYDQRFDKGEFALVPTDEVDSVTVDGAVRYVHNGPAQKADADTRSDLVAEAEALGIKVDARWGAKRIQAAIAEHHAATATAASSKRASLEARAREVFDAADLKALDAMSDDDLEAALADQPAA